MRQIRVAKYSKCGGLCCHKFKPAKEGGKRQMRLPASRSKKTKGYKVHIEEVKQWMHDKFDHVDTERYPWVFLYPDDIARELNINIGYVCSCIMYLRTKGYAIDREPYKSLPRDDARGMTKEQRQKWGWPYGSGFRMRSYFYYPKGRPSDGS